MGKRKLDSKHPITCIVSGLYADGKLAVARALLKELRSATVLVGDPAAKRALSTKEVIEYNGETPKLPHGVGNVVVLAHDLAQPSRIAAATTSGGRAAPKLLCVIDARSFLDEW